MGDKGARDLSDNVKEAHKDTQSKQGHALY